MRIRRGRLLRAAARVGFADKRRVDGPNAARYLSTTRYRDLVPEFLEVWREGGPPGSARKLWAAIRLALPVLVRGRRTATGVGAYFDLITDDARLFYGDNFHVGYFRSCSETPAEALDAHTDLVAEVAHLQSDRVRIVRGDARALDFPDGSFDAIVCLEAAGDICVTERDKDRLVRDLHRVLRPGGTSASPIWPSAPARRSRRTTR